MDDILLGIVGFVLFIALIMIRDNNKWPKDMK